MSMKKVLAGVLGILAVIAALVFCLDLLDNGPIWKQYDSAGRIVGERDPENRGRYHCYEYGENGSLKVKKVYSAHPGIFDPDSVYYYDDAGRIARWEIYTNGEFNGEYYIYSHYDTGAVQKEAYYRDNVLKTVVEYDVQGWVRSNDIYSAPAEGMTRKFYDSQGQVLSEETYKEYAGELVLHFRRTNYSEGGYRVDHYEADYIKSSNIIRSDGTRGQFLYEYKDGVLIRELYEGNLSEEGKSKKYIVYTYDAEAKAKTESHDEPNGKLIQEITVDWEPEK